TRGRRWSTPKRLISILRQLRWGTASRPSGTKISPSWLVNSGRREVVRTVRQKKIGSMRWKNYAPAVSLIDPVLRVSDERQGSGYSIPSPPFRHIYGGGCRNSGRQCR